MLDDLKYIHEKDSSDALGSAAKMHELLTTCFEVVGDTKNVKAKNIIFSAMGDSALAAMFVRVFPGVSIPLEIVRDYSLPSYADSGSLVVLASYSGNTEEALSIYAAAKAKNCRLMVIAAGGKLLEMAQQDGLSFVKIPQGRHPRYAGLYVLRAFLDILSLLNLTVEKEYENILHTTYASLERLKSSWVPDRPTSQNSAKQLALELMGKSVVVYSGPLLYPAAYKWKIGINQNAKQLAWSGQLPEYSHNEMTGWTRQPIEKPYAIIELMSSFEHPRITKRFEVGDRLTSGMRPEAIKVLAEGDTIITQLLYAFILGEMTSLYLALLNGVDPTPLKLVDKFKEAMGDPYINSK